MGFLPRKDAELNAYEVQFTTKYPAIAAALGIPTEEINETIGIIDDHKNAYSVMNIKKVESKASVENNTAKKGASTAEIRRVANLVKANKNYTEAIGQELGIIGSPEPDEDLTTIKPTLNGKIVGGNAVITFNKQKMQGVKIYSKRSGEADFVFLAIDTSSPYEDNRPKINTNLPEERQYHAIYICDDEPVGMTSDIYKLIVP